MFENIDAIATLAVRDVHSAQRSYEQTLAWFKDPGGNIINRHNGGNP